MTRTIAILSAALAAATAGCMGGRGGQAAHAPPAAATAVAPERPAPAGAGGMTACPMAVPGTQVVAADTAEGASITFTTSDPAQVGELRSRVHAMAAMHERHHHGAAGGMEQHGGMHHGSMHGEGMHHGGMEGSTGSSGAPGHAMPPPSRAVAEDVEGGARVLVTPEDPADAERLRSAVRTHARHMQESGRCAMDEAGSG